MGNKKAGKTLSVVTSKGTIAAHADTLDYIVKLAEEACASFKQSGCLGYNSREARQFYEEIQEALYAIGYYEGCIPHWPL